jgi:hypothetical protein
VDLQGGISASPAMRGADKFGLATNEHSGMMVYGMLGFGCQVSGFRLQAVGRDGQDLIKRCHYFLVSSFLLSAFRYSTPNPTARCAQGAKYAKKTFFVESGNCQSSAVSMEKISMTFGSLRFDKNTDPADNHSFIHTPKWHVTL